MDKILNMKVSELPGYSYLCSCGRNHSVDIKKIEVSKDAITKISEILEPFKEGIILIVCDNNTKKIAEDKVEKILFDAGFKVKKLILNTENYPILVPNENAIGRLLFETDDDVSVLLGVGSGTINDLCKIVSYKMKLPSVIVATAPSMDGYASTLSPLIIDKSKITVQSQYPYAIIADIFIMKDAPIEMFHAGFGDIVGKYTALADWQLTAKMNNEYYCETTATLVKNVVNSCVENVQAFVQRDEKAIGLMTEALILSGIAMGLVGISRPASGAEHHLAHFWELDALAKGKEHPLHGNSVGAGCIVVATAYKIMKDKYDIDVDVPDPEELKKVYKIAGAAANPKELGIDKELFRTSIQNAYKIRPRYTIFNYAMNYGYLNELSDVLTDIFYSEVL